MIKYILRRLLTIPFLMVFITAVLFFFMLQIPVEQRVQAYQYSGKPGKTLEEEQHIMQEIMERYGMNEPAPTQYLRWLGNVAKGDWGFSKTSRQEVLEGLQRRAPASIELALFALIPSVFMALFFGEMSVRHQNKWLDYLIRGGASIGWAFPSFILGIILMNIFYAQLGWFPPERLSVWANEAIRQESFHAYTGMHTVDALLNNNMEIFWDAVRHLMLPGITLAIAQGALLTRVMRASLLDVWKQDYITTARSKGLSEQRISSVHARRNAILPVISTVGVTFPTWLSSLVVIEIIFNFEGIGYWTAKSIQNLEMFVLVGFVLFSCTATVLASLVTDILYGIVNPQARIQS